MKSDIKDAPVKPFVYFPLVDMPGLVAIPLDELGIELPHIEMLQELGLDLMHGENYIATNMGTFQVVDGVVTTLLGDKFDARNN